MNEDANEDAHEAPAILSELEGDRRSQVRMQTEVCWPPAEISYAPE